MIVPTHLFWLVSAFVFVPVSCVYFPLNTWHVHVPYNFPINRPLMRVVAIRSNEDDGIDWLYSIDRINQDSTLFSIKVDPHNGSIFLERNTLKQIKELNVNFTISAKDKKNVKTTLAICYGSISFTQGDTLICLEPSEKACFLPAPFHLSIYENDPAQIIATLAYLPYRTLCQSNSVQYEINPDKLGLISVDRVTGDVETNQPLDREETSVVNFSIACQVTTSHGRSSNYSRVYSIRVLDVNDNGPVLRNGNRTDVYLELELPAESNLNLDSQILIHDTDSIYSSYESYFLEKDANEFFEVIVFDSGLDIGERGFYHRADIRVKKKLEFQGDNYTFHIIFEDKGMANIYGNNKKVVLEVILHNTTASLSKTKNCTVLSQYNVSIYSSATRNTKILDPSLFKPNNCKIGKHNSNFIFSIEVLQSDLKGIFNVTPFQGIVYLQDPLKLSRWRNASFRLKWTSQSDSTLNNSTLINIAVIKGNDSKVCDEASSCAEYLNSDDCTSNCGRGAGQGLCQWWSLPIPIPNPATTCVANTKTCPDKICDELEEMDEDICPQDCAVDIRPPSCKGQRKRGMDPSATLGVFWCNPSNLQCYCFSVPNPPERNNRKKTTSHTSMVTTSMNSTAILHNMITIDTERADAKCDARCAMLIALGVGLPLLFSLIFFIVWCIHRRQKIRAGRPKYLGSAMSLSAVPSDYVDERSSSVVSQAISINDSLLTGVQKMHIPIDTKWEFPRNQLIIEQTLGEGEFGRVMRAKAFGIAGNPGFSTVAVKMLKSNGTHVELQDLLSEYNLLKEVTHQNVIKLLGACTDKGGPFYIIVEYAEQGSLRSYLRRSRQLEFDTYASEDSGVGSLLLAPATSSTWRENQTSPRDLLSFMWQISKGMSYLSEMKVVHRDLATRNILIAADKVVKISDFGLSRDVYEGDAYFKRSKGRVPVKWMAIESLINHIYTSKSDVWAFGIVLWEIVMLGSTPYPGVPPERLFYLLKAGYRMEKPENCSDELYHLMNLCWRENPHERPSFREITCKLDRMLQDKVEYLDLGFNIVHNMTYFEDNQDDVEDDEADDDADSEGHRYGSLNMLPRNKPPQEQEKKQRVEGAENHFLLPLASTSQCLDSDSRVVMAEAIV